MPRNPAFPPKKCRPVFSRKPALRASLERPSVPPGRIFCACRSSARAMSSKTLSSAWSASPCAGAPSFRTRAFLLSCLHSERNASVFSFSRPLLEESLFFFAHSTELRGYGITRYPSGELPNERHAATQIFQMGRGRERISEPAHRPADARRRQSHAHARALEERRARPFTPPPQRAGYLHFGGRAEVRD